MTCDEVIAMVARGLALLVGLVVVSVGAGALLAWLVGPRRG